MQLKQKTAVSLITASLCALFALGLALEMQAQEKKADPTGTWTWTQPGRNGGPDRKMTLKLKTEGDKVTGKLASPGRDGQASETEIQDGKIKGDELTFTLVREFGGNKMTFKYSGKVTADAIKGKVDTERDGQTRSRDWEAKRATEKKD